MAYGGPGSLDEVEPYLQDVRGGRPTAPEFVQEIRQRYARIGGRAPIRELTEGQAGGGGRAVGGRVGGYGGIRDWHPPIGGRGRRNGAGGERRGGGGGGGAPPSARA